MRSKKLFYYLIKVIWNSACKKCCAKNEPQLSQQKQKSLNINIYLLSNFNLTGRYLSYIIVHAQISRSLQRCIRCCNFSVASITFITYCLIHLHIEIDILLLAIDFHTFEICPKDVKLPKKHKKQNNFLKILKVTVT